ncbi:MAG: DMT family transporter [Paracoccaceae bacterium]
MLALGVIWGGAFMATALALRGFGPITTAAGRTGSGTLVLTGLMVATGRPWPPADGRLWAYLVAIGLTFAALPFWLLAWGLQHVPSVFAGIAMAVVPVVLLPLAHLFSDEPLVARKAAGVALGLSGALVLMGPDLAGLWSGAPPLGQLACLAAAACYAVASILTRLCPPVDPLALATAGLGVATIALTPLALTLEGLPVVPGPVPLAALIALGALPTGIAALLRVAVVRSAGSVFMSQVSYQVPVWSMIFGALVLGEALPWRFFAALALILLGLWIAQRRPEA